MKPLDVFAAASLCSLMAAWAASSAQIGMPQKLTLTSSAFRAGAEIPRKYTCDGSDVSPPLRWQNVPAGTQAFALIADDPDAPGGTWVHWVLYDLPPETIELAEGQPKTGSRPWR